MNIRVVELGEPHLEFGRGKTGENPKAILPEAGPFLPQVRPPGSLVRLGLVSLPSEIEHIHRWFDRLERLIVSNETNVLRYPAFPGVKNVIGETFAVDRRATVKLSLRGYQLAVSRSGAAQFSALLDLYAEAIRSLCTDSKPDCILVQFPEEIASLRIENPSLSFEHKQILQRLKADEESAQLSLFGSGKEARKEAEELIPLSDELLSRNFHRALKARCMMWHNAVPIQILRRQTYISEEAKQSDATRAWNLTTGLYYKAGHIPWRPAHLPPGVCFAGVSFHHLKRRGGNLVYSSVAHAFSNDLEPFILKGDTIPHSQTHNKQPYLNEEQADNIVQRLITGYERRMGVPPSRIVIHKTSHYQLEEERGFRRAAKDQVASIDPVWLTPTGFRLLRRGMQEPNRGTVCQVGDERNFLFTTGYMPAWGEYPGPHIPAPLEIGADDVLSRAREILSLTKMNWNSADGVGRLPITLSFARRVGMIMTELDEDAEPNPSYRFYM